ncbi:hypothetical protein [Dialister micraerophilus]|uniref:hypothetical protein n=1 Tax=Dialister micraerophilus TaxID=309120 RepID=UPI0023EF76F4|nr:hypothetical protein [Dialister micraerophilus]
MNEKIKKITIICVICVVFCVFATLTVLSLIGTRKDIQNHGNGTNAARDEFRSIEEAQRTERKSINETEKAINRGKQAVDESTRTNKSIEKLERKDAEIITECQQIFARVRKRTATEN